VQVSRVFSFSPFVLQIFFWKGMFQVWGVGEVEALVASITLGLLSILGFCREVKGKRVESGKGKGRKWKEKDPGSGFCMRLGD
jgi:hypothetical protein